MNIFDFAFVAILQFMAASVILGTVLGSIAIYVLNSHDRRAARRSMFIHIPPHYPLGRCR
jgi:uncharacterized membrane protein